MLLVHLPDKTDAPKGEKRSIFGAHRLKKGPRRRFGGCKFVADYWFLTFVTKEEVSHCSDLSITFLSIKLMNFVKTLVIYFETKKWPYILFPNMIQSRRYIIGMTICTFMHSTTNKEAHSNYVIIKFEFLTPIPL